MFCHGISDVSGPWWAISVIWRVLCRPRAGLWLADRDRTGVLIGPLVTTGVTPAPRYGHEWAGAGQGWPHQWTVSSLFTVTGHCSLLTLDWTLVLPRCSPGDITVSYEGRRDVTEQRRQPDTSRGELGHTGNQFWVLVVWSAMTQT